MTARDILLECMRRRIRLTPAGANLTVDSVGDVPPDFEQVLRDNKFELIKLLTAKRHLARQILQGEFDGSDGRTFHAVRESLCENYLDLACRAALDHLKVNQRAPHHR